MRYVVATLMLSLTFYLEVMAQQVQISFTPKWSNETLVFGKYYPVSNSNDSVRVDVVKFYITNISLWKQGNQVYSCPVEHHLINLETNNTIDLNIPQQISYDTIQFFIGTDSITNTLGAMHGDLDAMHGMYWAWQSGYINVKIEGASSICKTRKNLFQYHLGGYLSPNQTRQQVTFAMAKHHINITIPFDKILQLQTLQNTPEVMSPGAHAVINIQRFKKALKPLE
jgi:hypothetical protein